MPRKNSLKTYVEGGYYHLYNRGVEKRKIFLDDRDYKTFLYFLKRYLQPPDPKDLRFSKQRSLAGEINLLVYCLMSNHFHLLVKQETRDGITKLMNRIGTNYGMYFNKRYERVGSLFQGVYKAVLIDNGAQLLHLSRYIHLNPYEIENRNFKRLADYLYSSYGDYLGKRKTGWVKTEDILSYFRTERKTELVDYSSYQSFVEDYKGKFDLAGLTLEG